MTISYLPVLPPDLRPIIKLQDGTVVTSDINFLYSKIINSNNRITKLKKMQVSEIFLKNEKYVLQETIDSLLDNGKNGKTLLNKKTIWLEKFQSKKNTQ